MKAPGRQAGGRQLALQRLAKSRGAAKPHAGRGPFGRALAQALGGQAAFALAGDDVQRHARAGGQGLKLAGESGIGLLHAIEQADVLRAFCIACIACIACTARSISQIGRAHV